ncbi:PQQ-binding-like beta-propeller repeat protein [Phycisphaeraceae bacterium D3-23]
MTKASTSLIASFCIYLCASVVANHAWAEDWPVWGRDASRNMASDEPGTIPVDFAPGEEIGRSGQIDPESTRHVRWIAKLGSQAFGNPVVADGRILVGTNNESPRDDKYRGDRSVFYCLDEATGEMIWQLNLPKLGAGKVSDWEFLGMCSSPAVAGDKVYVVTNLCEVVCLDLNGMANGNQGFQDEGAYYAGEGNPALEIGPTDADVLWVYDMRSELNVFPHNITSNSCLVVAGAVYVATSNGVDWSHINVPTPNAPSLIALDAETGELVGEDGAGIGPNILHCNWSSPSYGEFGGQETIVFGAGDGFLYGFSPDAVEDDEGFAILPTLWKVDGNLRSYRFDDSGEPIPYATPPGPSEFIATPVIYEGLVYAAIGQDPEHGEGVGALTCVDPTQVDGDGTAKIVWQFTGIGRSISTCSIVDGLVFVADYAGQVYCLDAKTGALNWTHDTLGHIWSSTLVADGKVFLGNEDGILYIFEASPEKNLLMETEFPAPIYSSAVYANGTFYLATQSHLFAISADAE